jgi:hypothetical protein
VPGFPLLDDFTRAELRSMQVANLPHTCTVQNRDAAGVWSDVKTLVPCRLSHVSAMTSRAGDVPLRPETEWLLAFAPSSPYAGPRRRYIVSGERPDGTAFVTRTLYALGARVPHVEESVATVECAETAPAGA